MVKKNINKYEFFHQFTVKLCSSMDIKKAVYQCSLFFKELIPFNLVHVALITDTPYELKQSIMVMSDGELLDERVVPVPAEGWAHMMKHLASNEAKLMYAAENREYLESLAGYSKNIAESYDISLPLVFEGQPLGFFVIRGKNEFTNDQIELITSVKEPITHAVAASIRFENGNKHENEAFSADMVFNRIKLLCDINTDKKLAKILSTFPTNIANCKLRNSIPYDKIVLFCQRERIPTDYIFMYNPFILNKTDNNGFYKVMFPSGEERISAADAEDLLKLPQGSLDIYRKTCALSHSIIPPIEMLPVETLELFQNALLGQQALCTNTSIPVASGSLLENGQAEKTDNFFHFCKEWAKKLSLSESVFAYHIMDDSMIPTLSKGDIVLVDPEIRTPKTIGIYAVTIGDNIFIKRLMPAGKDTLTMICDNKIYPSGTISHNDIIGKVVWHARNM